MNSSHQIEHLMMPPAGYEQNLTGVLYDVEILDTATLEHQGVDIERQMTVDIFKLLFSTWSAHHKQTTHNDTSPSNAL